MAAALPPFASTKETTNYARLCRLMVDVGSQVLRSIFDKIHPPATLPTVLAKTSSHFATLQSLYKGKKKVLNPTQWGKLYPAHSPVSSATFDITLLTVLLRNICGLSPPATGWDHLPPATNTGIADDIARVKYYRNTVYGHASQASVDDINFSFYWQEIREALVRLGGAHFRVEIDNLEHDCMDPGIEEHYRELMRHWKKDDDSIKDKLEEIEGIMKKMRGIVEENLRDTTGKIESEIKDVKGKLYLLTTSAKLNKAEETMKGSLEQKIREFGKTLAKINSELKEVKEKMGASTISSGACKDKGHYDSTELIDGIRQLYETREGWLSPFPWCEEFQFFVADIFTRLKVVRRKKTRGDVTNKIITMSSLLNPHEECSKPRTVLIEGKPGMGKTTYCKKFVYDWATKRGSPHDFVSNVKVVLFLKCRDFESDIWEAIDDQLLPRDIDENVKEQFFKFIRANQSSILLILDGLDELPSREVRMVSEIIAGRVLPKCYVVATARHEAGRKVRQFCDTLLEVKGFTEAQAREFIAKYFKGKSELAEKLSARISHDKNLKEMCANPLNTALLCLLCEEFAGALAENRTKLYLNMIECVLRRYRKKVKLPDTEEDLTNLYKLDLRALGSIAFNGLIEDKLDFEEKELVKHASNLTAFGFLSVHPGGSKLRPSLHYAFLHKSFQECFAAFYVCCEIRDKRITPQELVSNDRYFSNLKQVLLFSCGILAEQSDQEAAALVSNIGNRVKNNTDNYNWGLRVVLEAINECQRKKDDFHLQLARRFGCSMTQKYLNIREHHLVMELRAIFCEAIKVNKTLMFLDLSRNAFRDVVVKTLAEAIKVNNTLTNLDFSFNPINDACAKSIAEAIKVNHTLTKLNLSYGAISDFGATFIAEAIKVNNTLTNLGLSGNPISDAGATSIAEAIKVNNTLTNLGLSGNPISDAGATSIAETIKVNNTLTDLSLSGNQITDVGATSIAEAIKVNHTLTNLGLSGNQISDAGAASIAEAIKVNKTLTNLVLSGNQISDVGATSIAEAIKVNKTLTNLGLSVNQISDAGAKSIAAAIKVNKTLTNLHLSFNPISDVGAKTIAEAREVNRTLTFLSLYGKQISGTTALSTRL